MKAPLIFAGPGIPQGSSDALAYLLDIFPTLTDCGGLPEQPGLDGRSLRPIITGKSKSVRETLVCAYRGVQRSIRDDRWKLIRYPQINKTQLFDLQADPHETHNLAEDATQAERVTRMLDGLAAWQVTMGDKLPLTSDNPQPAEWTPPAKAK